MTCPNCGATMPPQEIADGWCETCGKRLPAYLTPKVGPLTRQGDSPGQSVNKALAQARHEAAGILFTIAVLQLVCGTTALVMAPAVLGGPIPRDMVGWVIVEMVGITAVFATLGFLALKTPLPAAAIGLVLYLLLTLAAVVANPQMGLRGFYIKIIIISCWDGPSGPPVKPRNPRNPQNQNDV